MIRKRTNNRPESHLNTSDVGPRFGSTKPVTARVHGAVTLAVLSALLLVAALRARAQTETVLYNSTGGIGGAHPWHRLTPDGAGNFYGTAQEGGLGCPTNGYGCGVVYELSPNGNGGWNYTMLYSFPGPPDGANPAGPVILDSAGNLYGTTQYGGSCNTGTVFELSPAGTNWTESTLFDQFCYSAAVGVFPVFGLIMDARGNLYGTTWGGGGAPGTVFELRPSGGGWTGQVIYSGDISSGLAVDAAGSLFGATRSTAFKLSPDGSGGGIPL